MTKNNEVASAMKQSVVVNGVGVPTRPAESNPVTVSALLSTDRVKNRFNELLGKKSAGFISSIISLSNSSNFVGVNPQTVISSSVVAATLDLPIVPSLGFAYVVPYKNKGKAEAQFQLGYKGYIQLAMRTGLYQTINVTDVRERELISEDMLSGEIRFERLKSSERVNAKVIGYAAYFRLLNGFTKTFYMSKEEVEAHAKTYSQSYRFDKYGTSLWSTQFDLMAKKTVLKLLLSKYGPLSIEMQMAQKFDQAVVHADIDTDIESAQVDYIDNKDDIETSDEAEIVDQQPKVDIETGELFPAE